LKKRKNNVKKRKNKLEKKSKTTGKKVCKTWEKVCKVQTFFQVGPDFFSSWFFRLIQLVSSFFQVFWGF